MNDPLVSIIIPVHNSVVHLEATILSALSQQLADIELLVIDDGSSDGSLEIANRYASEQVKVFTQQNCGAAAARNVGIRHARGKYIQFLDADDLLSQDKIAAQLQLLNGHEDLLSICSTVYFHSDITNCTVAPGDAWLKAGSKDPVDFLLKLYADQDILPGYGGMITIHSWLTPKALLEKAGGFDPALNVDDDGELFCRVVLASKGIIYAESGVAYYRKHIGLQSLSSQKSQTAYQSRFNALNLKYNHMSQRTSSPLLNPIFGRHYWELAMASFPQEKIISENSKQIALSLGRKKTNYKAGKLATLLSRILGWRLMRRLSYYKHGF